DFGHHTEIMGHEQHREPEFILQRGQEIEDIGLGGHIERRRRLVGIPRPAERMENYALQFSGGMRQRVCIALALACRPKLL
ncbi:ATP-binding cassette domain-containing protein, partial [Rhizobium leguminosarum]|uniref:ATP-binding cassette domain-containing protein n=1 Tax=Rhizobium leguminosarum TaxID=384 RepID=UPI003F9A7F67